MWLPAHPSVTAKEHKLATVENPRPESESLRVQLQQVNERSRRYSSQLWQIPFAFIGVAVLIIGNISNRSLNQVLVGVVFFALTGLGVAIIVHIQGMADGHK